MKKLNKFQISVLAFFQIIFIIGLIQDFIGNKAVKEPARTTLFLVGIILMGIVIICVYLYIIIKFWQIRKKSIYKFFVGLNIIYLINEILNMFKISSNINNKFLIIPNTIICVFLIINLVLILIYNRSVRALEK